MVLGMSVIGTILESQANNTATPFYQSLYAYLAAILLAVSLVFLGRGLLARVEKRATAVLQASKMVAAAAFILVAGYSLVSQIVGWTVDACLSGGSLAPGACLGLIAPTFNQAVASVVLDI